MTDLHAKSPDHQNHKRQEQFLKDSKYFSVKTSNKDSERQSLALLSSIVQDGADDWH